MGAANVGLVLHASPLSDVQFAEVCICRGLIVDIIILQGMLYGKNREVPCEVLAWRRGADSKLPYSQLRVADAPNDLPDGDYTLRIDGMTVSTKRKDGSWMVVPFEQSS